MDQNSEMNDYLKCVNMENFSSENHSWKTKMAYYVVSCSPVVLISCCEYFAIVIYSIKHKEHEKYAYTHR